MNLIDMIKRGKIATADGCKFNGSVFNRTEVPAGGWDKCSLSIAEALQEIIRGYHVRCDGMDTPDFMYALGGTLACVHSAPIEWLHASRWSYADEHEDYVGLPPVLGKVRYRCPACETSVKPGLYTHIIAQGQYCQYCGNTLYSDWISEINEPEAKSSEDSKPSGDNIVDLITKAVFKPGRLSGEHVGSPMVNMFMHNLDSFFRVDYSAEDTDYCCPSCDARITSTMHVKRSGSMKCPFCKNTQLNDWDCLASDLPDIKTMAEPKPKPKTKVYTCPHCGDFMGETEYAIRNHEGKCAVCGVTRLADWRLV